MNHNSKWHTKPKRGQICIIYITKLVYEGKGLGTLDSEIENHAFKIFVPNTLPGDVVEARVGRVKRSYAEAKCLRFIESSNLRSQSECVHFPICGGCQLIDVDYEKQCDLKERIIKDAATKLFPSVLPQIKPVIGADQQTYYRNKMEFSFGKGAESIFLGLKQRGFYDRVVDLKICYFQSELSNHIRKYVSAYFTAQLFQEPEVVWDYQNNKGFLKSMIIRDSKTTQDVMIVFIVSSDLYKKYGACVALLAQKLSVQFPKISSISVGLSTNQGDLDWTANLNVLYGKPILIEDLDGLKMTISPVSFFQTNTAQMKVLYAKVAEIANLKKTDKILDLYCGIGSIGLYLSKYVKSVVGIEEVAPAIEDAKMNAANNHIKNASFICGRVKNILKYPDESISSVDALIVDPPRSGMVPKALSRVIDLKVPKVIYVSCNPVTLLRDLNEFSEAGYEVEVFQPVDMFPNTFHCEVVVLLILPPLRGGNINE